MWDRTIDARRPWNAWLVWRQEQDEADRSAGDELGDVWDAVVHDFGQDALQLMKARFATLDVYDSSCVIAYIDRLLEHTARTKRKQKSHYAEAAELFGLTINMQALRTRVALAKRRSNSQHLQRGRQIFERIVEEIRSDPAIAAARSRLE